MTNRLDNGDPSIEELTRSGVYKRFETKVDMLPIYSLKGPPDLIVSESTPTIKGSIINDW